MKIVGQSSKALALLLMLASGFAAYAANTEKPNIIVIMADDMGFSDLGCYGGEIQTPNIDQLAREGVRFIGFRNTARCTPSRASLLTGRYAHSVGVGSMSRDRNLPGYRGQLSTDAPTMAEILKPHGYATGIVGKWHQTVTGKTDQKQLFPLDRGFDFFHGTWWGAKDYFRPRFMMKNRKHLEEGDYPEDYYLTEDLSHSAIEFVQNQIDQGRPFYLYLAHYAPHAPIQAPADRVQKCFDRYMGGFETLQRERFTRQRALGVIPENAEIAAGMPSWDELSGSQKRKWAEMMATYAAMIEVTHLSSYSATTGPPRRGKAVRRMPCSAIRPIAASRPTPLKGGSRRR
jgi:arylsulfatase